MATNVEGGDLAVRAPARGFMADQGYFTRFTIILALFILFGFAQFSMRGFVDVRGAPLLTHLHGAFMVAWLGLAVTQNILVGRDELRIHRKLGWIAAALVAGIAVLGVTVGFSAVAGHRVPPFFSNPYFLALTIIEPIVFAAVVAWGVSLRRNTQWHRRAMLGATVIILEPALGRLLPMPLMGGWGEWAILALQLLVLTILARHDRKILGKVHPATLWMMAIVTSAHLLVLAVSAFAPFAAFAEAVAAR
jgi:uncharacterized membrane protein YozB (DUF420 family)